MSEDEALRRWGIRQWRLLHNDLTITELPPWAKPLVKPTDEALDQFEQESGFRLPLSYRAFIKVFGPGELACEFRLFAPGYAEQAAVIDLGMLNTDIKDRLTDEELRSFRDPGQIRRVVFFCGTDYGDLIGWDPADVQDRRGREYGIYEWRLGETLPKVADSFPQFIHEVCLGPDSLHPPGQDDERMGTRRQFMPWCAASGLTER